MSRQRRVRIGSQPLLFCSLSSQWSQGGDAGRKVELCMVSFCPSALSPRVRRLHPVPEGSAPGTEGVGVGPSLRQQLLGGSWEADQNLQTSQIPAQNKAENGCCPEGCLGSHGPVLPDWDIRPQVQWGQVVCLHSRVLCEVPPALPPTQGSCEGRRGNGC